MELRAVEPRVRLQPVWGDEAGGDEHNHDEPEAERHVPRQGALPVGVGVGQQVVAHTHLATSQQQQQQEQGQLHCSDHSHHHNHPRSGQQLLFKMEQAAAVAVAGQGQVAMSGVRCTVGVTSTTTTSQVWRTQPALTRSLPQAVQLQIVISFQQW